MEIARNKKPDRATMNHKLANRLGTATLTPCATVVAGSYQQWTLTLRVGSYGIDERGTIKVAQRFACDMQPAQFDEPAAPAYCTVTTSGDAKLAPRFAPKGHDRPWMRWCVVVDIYDGSLSPGDTVTLTLGNRSNGSPGIRAQTFIESAHEFRIFVDPTNASVVRPIAASPTFPIISDKPTQLIAIVPSDAVAGRPFDIFVKGQDRWGNPTATPDDVRLQCENALIDGTRITCQTPGTVRINVIAENLQCVSNPVVVHETTPAHRRYWGDLHAQSDATVGVGTEVEYFTFARDFARVDFASHQGNDFQVDDDDWKRLNDTVRLFHENGRFVVFPGFEWSANSSAGGDRNVFYLEEDLPIIRNSHWQIPHVPENEVTPAHPANVFFERLKRHVPHSKVILGSHVGGRWANVKAYFDPDAHNLVEIVSCWGVFEWILFDALDAGHIVGVMCNSDGHKGRPGAEGPGAGEFGISGGLTCVLADDLSRAAVWEALQARRCYGTTGARIVLELHADSSPMGSVLSHDSSFHAHAIGTAPLESLQLYRGRDIIHEVRPANWSVTDSNCVRVKWSGSLMRGRGRRVDWSGTIHTDVARIQSATEVSFDASSDGVTEIQPHAVKFRSLTTGDADGLDLILDNARRGRLIFDTPVCKQVVDLTALTNGLHAVNCGGLDMHLEIQRYPMCNQTLELDLTTTTVSKGAYFVKAIQSDGHLAWSSPIYIDY